MNIKPNQMMFPQNDLLFVKLQLKKTKSECRKYSICLAIFSSLSHMYSCQRTGYVHKFEGVV